MDPHNVETLNQKGLTLGSINKYKEALESFDKALKVDSKNVKIWYNKGLIYARNKKVQEALEHFDKIIP